MPQPKRDQIDPKRSFFLLRATDADGDGLPCTIEAADSGSKKVRTITMTAYTGGALDLMWWDYPVVVDLSRLQVSAKPRPLLRDHNPSKVIGRTDEVAVISGSRLEIKGTLSGANADTREVIESADQGQPWQASIGARPTKNVEFVKSGATVRVNGRDFIGPLYVVEARLKEISVVALGADDDTESIIAAMAARTPGADPMKFPNRLLDPAAAGLGNEGGGSANATDNPGDEGGEPGRRKPLKANDRLRKLAIRRGEASDDDDGNDEAANPAAEMRAAAVAEKTRQRDIRALCAGSALPQAQRDAIEIEALDKEWDVIATERALLKAERSVDAPNIISGRPTTNADILATAASLGAGVSEKLLLRSVDQKTLDAADKLRYIGLRELIAASMRLDGMRPPAIFGDGSEFIRASYSTVSLPGILENVAGKVLLESYQSVTPIARRVCRVGRVENFNQVSRVRLLGTGAYELVGESGELKAGKLGEQKFTAKAETRGQWLTLTREHQINDDLGAFLDLFRMAGVGAGDAIEHVFAQKLLGAGSFFHTNNGNLLEGADVGFSFSALARARENFAMRKVGPGPKKGKLRHINVLPQLLLGPPALEMEMDLLLGSPTVQVDGAGDGGMRGTTNPFYNRLQKLIMPHLQNDDDYAGASADDYYLFADPVRMAAAELSFLKGKETPTIERVPTPANTLGISFQSYIDFGIDMQDPNAALKVHLTGG